MTKKYSIPEEKIVEERDSLKTILDAVPIGMIILDENMIIKEINDIAAKQIYKSSEEVRNTRFGDGFGCAHSFESEKGCGKGELCKTCNILNNIRKVIRTGESIHGLEVQHSFIIDGQEAEPWFRINCRPITINGLKYVAIVMDYITEKKAAEEEIIKSRDFYLTLIEQLPGFIWLADEKGDITYINNKLLEFVGRGAGEYKGEEWTKIIHPDDLEYAVNVYAEGVRTRRSFESYYRIRRSDGVYRWIISIGTPYNDNDGNHAGFIGTCYDITERKDYEDVLRRYQLLSEKVNDIILFIDMDGNIVDANYAAVKAYGYSYEELTGISINELRKSAISQKKIQNAYKHGAIFEIVHGRKDGSTFPVEVSASGAVIGNKKVLVSIIRDISERKKAEEELSLYKLLAENARDMIFLFDSNGRIIDANKVAVEAYGYNIEELLGNEISYIDKHTGVSTITKKVEDIYDGGEGFLFESIHTCKDGKTFPVEVSLQGAQIGDKRYIMSITRDITERKNAQKALRESEGHLRQITDNMLDVITQTDLNGNIIYTSPSHKRIMGVSMGEVTGSSMADRIHPEDRKRISKAFKRMVETRQLAREESRYMRPDGSYIWIESIANVITDDANKPVGAIIASRDISERVKAEEETMRAKDAAEEANRAKSEFLANMSHEIRTPLNGIMGMIDLTLLTELNQKQRENLSIAKDCAVSLLKVINDILDFSKIEAGKLAIENLEFDIEDIVKKVLDIHSVRAANKGLRLNYEISSQTPKNFVGDPSRLQQVLNNLIGNAVKFTDVGSVTLKVEGSGENNEKIKVSVIDTGIGISKLDMEKLFKSFSQVDSSITRKYGGTGLGLTISNRLIKMMGGSMWVESEKERGSTFCFILPPGENNIQKKEATVENHVNPIEPRKLNILMAEDDLVNQMITKDMLLQKGHMVDAAGNGKDALELLKNGEYDLILMDIQMPEMDGIKTTKVIRELEIETGKHIPIIAVTAYALQGDRERFLGSGMDGYLSKPFDATTLFDTIESVINSENASKGYDKKELPSQQDNQGTEELIKKIFIQDSIRQLNLIREALRENDVNRVEQLVHSLKTEAAALAEDTIKNMTFKVELSLRRGDIGEAYELFKKLEEEFKRRMLSVI